MAKKERIVVGDLVDIEFLDHAEDAQEAMRFKICGEVAKATRWSYIIRTWRYCDEMDRAKDDNTKENENSFAIVKKAILSIRKLR